MSVLIANPIPASDEVPANIMEVHIQAALPAPEKQKFNGKEVTPFLLKCFADHMDGESLEANIALVINNEGLAAKIVAEMK